MARSRNSSMLSLVVEPVPFERLSAALLSPGAELGPRDVGRVELIVQRPAVNERRVVESVRMSTEGGMEGSGWVERPERGRIDQLCVMSSAAITAIAGEHKPDWAPAGDQLFLSLDLSRENLPTGGRVRIGEVLARVTTKPHNGCAKFAKRYGAGALKVVSTPLSKRLRIRGLYLEVLQDGVVNVGDEVVVLRDK